MNISLSQFSPVWSDALFEPGQMDARFQLWTKIGISKITDLYKEEVLYITFQGDFFFFFQILATVKFFLLYAKPITGDSSIPILGRNYCQEL